MSGRKKIIIVDDDPSIRKDIRQFLEKNNYFILEGSNGLEGIEVIRKNQDCSLIVSDLNMPNMTGFEMLEHLAKEGLCISTPKVILTTDFMTDNTNRDFMAERGKELGVSCWFVKPFDNDSKRSHFVSVLETILEKK